MTNSIKENEPAALSTNVSPFIKEMIGMLLDKNPETRPDAKTLLKNEKIFSYARKIIN